MHQLTEDLLGLGVEAGEQPRRETVEKLGKNLSCLGAYSGVGVSQQLRDLRNRRVVFGVLQTFECLDAHRGSIVGQHLAE